MTFEVPVTSLRYSPENTSGAFGGSATSNDGIISTRLGNAGSWTAMIGKSPAGSWRLTLPNTEVIQSWFTEDQIRDILLVITYAGLTPPWPK